MENLAIEVG